MHFYIITRYKKKNNYVVLHLYFINSTLLYTYTLVTLNQMPSALSSHSSSAPIPTLIHTFFLKLCAVDITIIIPIVQKNEVKRR